MHTKTHQVIGAYFLSILMLFSSFTPTYAMLRDLAKGKSFYLTEITAQKGGALPVDQVDLSTGTVTFQEPLFSVEGYQSILTYNSEGVAQKASLWNRDQKEGIIGLGWAYPEDKIVRITHQTGTTKDDNYMLYSKGNTFMLLFISEVDQEKEYRINSQPDWIVKHHLVSDQWKVYHSDGQVYIYGDGSLITHESNSEEYNVKWKNWIGSSTVVENQSQIPIVYNLSAIETIYSEQVKFYYQRQEEEVGDQGKKHTRSNYLTRVEGLRGKTVDFTYQDKDAKEFIDPHTEKSSASLSNDKDAYQERYKNQYLSSIALKNRKGNLMREIQLEYDFINPDTELRKRLLTKIKYLDSKGISYKPSTMFNYFGLDITDNVKAGYTKDNTKLYNPETGALYGAIKQYTKPEGISYAYRYGKQKIEGSSTDIEISFPANPINETYGTTSRWSAPELFYGSDYVVAIFESQDLTKRQSYVKVYHWIGDRWVEKDLGKFKGYFYDRYLSKDQYTKGVFKQLKEKVFEKIAAVSPVAMSVINGFEDALKGEAKSFYKVGEDVISGDIGTAIQNWYKGQFTVIKDIVLDIASGLEKEAEKLKELIEGEFGSGETQFINHQKELYTARDKDAAKHPRKVYHVTLQDTFFVLVSSEGESQVIISYKNNLVLGEWIQKTEIANLTSKYFTLDSDDEFVAILDEITDFLYIYTWDGHIISTYSRQLRTDFKTKINETTGDTLENAFSSIIGTEGESVEEKLDHRSAISIKNNLIVAVITDSHGIHADISLLYHDENMNWKLKGKKINKKATLVGDRIDLNIYKEKIPLLSSFLGKDGKIDVQAGNSFAVLQTYDNWDQNIPDAGDIPILGDLITHFVPDMKKINSTFGIVWDENYENIQLKHLHTAAGQSEIESFIIGDVIHKVGKAHSLLIGSNDTLAPSDGKNYAYRYTGKEFLSKELVSPYYSSGYANDIASTLIESSNKAYKTPQFHQFNPNTLEWSKIENASEEQIPTTEFINEAINVSVDVKFHNVVDES